MSEPCRCERADAIKSVVSIAELIGKVSQERDVALAALARVAALLDPETAMAAGAIGSDRYFCESDIRAALQPTDQPKGKP